MFVDDDGVVIDPEAGPVAERLGSVQEVVGRAQHDGRRDDRGDGEARARQTGDAWSETVRMTGGARL